MKHSNASQAGKKARSSKRRATDNARRSWRAGDNGGGAGRSTYDNDDLDSEAQSIGEMLRAMEAKRTENPLWREQAAAIKATPFKWIEPSKIPMRQWLYRPFYIRKFSSLTVANGGVGKSAVVLAEALAMVTGKNLLGVTPESRLSVWIWNGEEPTDELQRRLAATYTHYGITEADIGDRLFIDLGRTMPITIAESAKTGTRIAVPVVEAVIKALVDNKVDVLIVDPFVACHRVMENDNSAVEAVAKSWSHIAETANCAVMLVHHSRKTYGNEASVDDARGASALLAAVRAARAINVMTTAEADKASIDPAERRRYIRSDSGKLNMARPAETADWFKLESVDLGNNPFGGLQGDDVGVATRWSFPERAKPSGAAKRRAWEAVKTGGPWRESVQAKKEPWAGIGIACALDIDLRLKHNKDLIRDLISDGVAHGWLERIEKADGNRRSRTYIRAAAAPPEA